MTDSGIFIYLLNSTFLFQGVIIRVYQVSKLNHVQTTINNIVLQHREENRTAIFLLRPFILQTLRINETKDDNIQEHSIYLKI